MSKYMNPTKSDSDAIFVGWQKTIEGDTFPIFTVTAADHPSLHSTVTGATLRKLNLRVPQTTSPYPETTPALWNELGIALNHPRTAREAILSAGLDYTVVKRPLGLKTGLQQEAYATVRSDNGDILGVVNESYTPVQNIDAFTFFDSLVAADAAVYETAGILGKGECVWILAKLPGYINVHGGDIVDKYILLTNGHAGGPRVRLQFIPIRAICNNTLTSALQGAGDISIFHQPDVAWTSQQAATMMVMTNVLHEELDIVFNAMAARSITGEQLREYVQALVPDNEESHHSARTEKIRASVLELHDSGRGAHLSRGTVWGAWNSVAEYTDHLMSDEDSTLRLNSIWFGRGEQLKAKAFRLAESMLHV